jgi:hypothetical protein
VKHAALGTRGDGPKVVAIRVDLGWRLGRCDVGLALVRCRSIAGEGRSPPGRTDTNRGTSYLSYERPMKNAFNRTCLNLVYRDD